MFSIDCLEWFKIPEGIRIPFVQGYYNRFIHYCVRKRATWIANHPEHFRRCRSMRSPEIIVSLTSFPARIHTVHVCLATLLRQTMPPDRIILWLAETQFPDHCIPDNLSELQKFGVEIHFCDEDLKGHKKYFYVLQEFPDAVVITVDDDLIYSESFVEKLYCSYEGNKDVIHCHRAQEIQTDSEGNILPYGRWKVLSSAKYDEASFVFMPSTGAGTLYPPGIFDAETFNREFIRKLSLSADDLWMKAMSLRCGVKIKKTKRFHRPLTTIEGSQGVTLADENIFNNQNDVCIRNLIRHYPSAFEKLCQNH